MRSPARSTPIPTASAPGVFDGGQNASDVQALAASVDLDRGRRSGDAQTSHAPVTLPPAFVPPNPIPEAPGADLLGTDRDGGDTQFKTVGADLTPDQWRTDAHLDRVGGSLNGDQPPHDAHAEVVAVSEGSGQDCPDAQRLSADPSDALLGVLADSLNDLEGLRKATCNQLSALTRDAGTPGGKGQSEFSKAAVKLGEVVGILEALEGRPKKERTGHASAASVLIDRDKSSLTLELKRALRSHPLGGWVKSTVGIGEKQGARLIAAIGDPYMRPRMEYDDGTVEEARPRRGPAELWAYCGYAPSQKRRKGVQSNWNAEAKMRAFLCAESCIKQAGGEAARGEATPKLHPRPRSPYRDVYDAARANWAGRKACPTCKGDCSDGHKHAHALRCVAKAILKDLWLAARANGRPQPAPVAPVSASGVNEREAA